MRGRFVWDSCLLSLSRGVAGVLTRRPVYATGGAAIPRVEPENRLSGVRAVVHDDDEGPSREDLAYGETIFNRGVVPLPRFLARGRKRRRSGAGEGVGGRAGAAVLAAVQAVDPLDVVVRQLEVEDLEVLADPLRRRRLGEHDAAALD